MFQFLRQLCTACARVAAVLRRRRSIWPAPPACSSPPAEEKSPAGPRSGRRRGRRPRCAHPAQSAAGGVPCQKVREQRCAPPRTSISIGTIGRIKAVNTFTPERSIKLHASRCIGNEILMYLRKTSNRRQEASLDEPLNVDGDGNELLLSDILGSDENMVGQQLEQDAERAGLRRAVSSLSARERRIMELRFGLTDGVERTQKEAADALGISQSYTSC